MTTTPTTPEEWLPVLSAALDRRHPVVSRLRRYARGRADLPEMNRNLRASWQAFQKRARTDYGGAAVRSLRNRIRAHGVRLGTSDDHEHLATVRRIIRDNRGWVVVGEAVRDYIETGVGYLVVSADADGSALLTREKPETFYAEPTPGKPWKARATLKVWRDRVAKLDFAQVRTAAPGMVQLFSRPAVDANGAEASGAGGGWSPAGDPSPLPAGTDVAILDRGDDGPFLGPHLDVIDRINHGKLNRLVIVAMQAFRQRALKPEEGDGLPASDEDGNTIDWGKALEPAPGALWELPAGIDIWESQTAEVLPLLKGEETDARDFCAATGTPISVLIPDSQNQSASGASTAKEMQISQARDDIERIRPAIEVALVYALRVEGVDLGDDTLEVLFAPPEHVSLSERYAAAVQAKGAGLSSQTIKRDILGMTPDQIKQDEADAGSALLAAALLGGGERPRRTPDGEDGVAAWPS